jgi:beta-galactosidase
VRIGAYYYPEQWPRSEWQRDFDNIAKMGLQIVHMAEFAWFELEPKPGKFQFDWLSDCLELARQRNLDVILCTPTAAPPIWLSHSLPQTLPMREGNIPGRFGGRRHYNPLSEDFRHATRRIVSAMAEKFADHPSVIGWQIDNEFSGNFDQSPATHAAFAAWLGRKYGDIKTLNDRWGNQFWNTYYTDFSQIQLPANRDVIVFPPGTPPKYDNPHHHLDASRFWSWAFADFNRIQAEILKPKIGNRFLTTNFMPFHLDCDPGDFAKELNLFSWDSYPVTGWDTEDGETYRIADPAPISFVHDQMASYHSRWALMEVQPGQLNWSGTPARVYPGAIRLWLWTAFAHGAEFVTVYRFRQPRFGVEMFHHGLMTHDGVTPTAGGREFAQVISEMKQLDLRRVPKLASEQEDWPNTAGIVFDFDQLWEYATLPQAKRWNQSRWLTMWYAALTRLGMKIKILRPEMDWPRELPIVVAPGLQMLDPKLLEKLKDYASHGGNLVLTCRTGLMDRNGQMFDGPTAAPILEMIGAEIDAYDALRENRSGQINFADKKYPWSVWGDQIVPKPGTKVLATYADQFYAGAAAITQAKFANGIVNYFGVFSEPPLVEAFVQSLLNRPALPARVQIQRRGPYRIALNYQAQPVEIPVGPGAKFLIGSAKIGPCDVAVWEE